MRALLGLIIGAILGVPVSYYFQSGLIRAFVSLPSYTVTALESLPQMLTQDSQTSEFAKSIQSALTTPVYTSVAITAVLGLLLGLYLDNKEKKKSA